MAQTVFVTGGSGFVGSAVLDELAARSHAVRALVRPGGRPVPDRGGRVAAVPADLYDPSALAAAMAGCDAAVHLVGVIAERPAAGVTFEGAHVDGTRAVLDAAGRAGVRRYVHMSALGTRPAAVSAYHRTKWAAEALVRASGLDWTIFRPGLIHGPRGDFTRMQAAWARRRAMPFLFMPYFAGGPLGLDGGRDVQPVYVGDVARAFADAVDQPATTGKTYDVVGPDRMRWPAMHKAFARAITGKARATAGIPLWYASALAHVVPAKLLPFNLAQVQMAAEDNVGDPEPLATDLGWHPRPYEATVRDYAKELATDEHG